MVACSESYIVSDIILVKTSQSTSTWTRMSISLSSIILGDHCHVYMTCHWPKHHYAIQGCKPNQQIQHYRELSMTNSEKIWTGNIYFQVLSWDSPHISWGRQNWGKPILQDRFEAGSYVFQVDLKFTIQMRITANFWLYCIYLPRVRITDMCHHACFVQPWRSNPGVYGCWIYGCILPTELHSYSEKAKI